MKIKILPILLLLAGCGPSSQPKQEDVVVIQNINTDFPTVKPLTEQYAQKFNIVNDIASYHIKDTLLFTIEIEKENIGYCYNINNGKVLSKILSLGKANNELLNVDFGGNIIQGDSMQLKNYNQYKILTFSIQDVATKPIGERNYSITTIPDSLRSATGFIKTKNNSVIGVNSSSRWRGNTEQTAMKYFQYQYDKNKLTLFGKLDDELFDMEETKHNRRKHLFFSLFTIQKDKAAMVNQNDFLLEIIDLKNSTITHKRYYSKIDGRIKSAGTYSAVSNDKLIYCLVGEKTKESKGATRNYYVYTFDWELNPKDKFHLGAHEARYNRFAISDDGKTAYRIYLDTEKSEQKLYKYDIK